MEEIARRLVPVLQQNGIRKAEAASTVTTTAWSCDLNGVRISCWLAITIVLLFILLA